MARQQSNIMILRLERASAAAAVMGLAIGIIGILGWAADSALLKSILPGAVTIKVNGALGMAFVGASLWFLRKKDTAHWRIRLGRTFALFAALVGVLSILEDIVGIDLIDNLIFAEAPGAIGTSSPGRIAPNAALCFTFLGAALLLLDVRILGRRPTTLLSGLAAFISGLASAGYLFGISNFYGVASYTQMAIHVAFGLPILAAGVVFSRPTEGVMAEISAANLGAVMARRYLLVTFTVPMIMGLLVLGGERNHVIDAPFGLSFLVLSTVVLYSVVTWINARILNRVDSKRIKSEERQRLLAEASLRLAEVSDYDRIVSVVAEYLIVEFASWGFAQYLKQDGDGNETAVAVTASDRKVLVIAALDQDPSDAGPDSPLKRALRGQSTLFAFGEREYRAIARQGPQYEMLLRLAPNSVIFVPIGAGDKIFGVLAVGRDAGASAFTDDDRIIMEEIGRRTGIAMENALLLDRTRKAVLARDDILAIVSHDLKNPLMAVAMRAELLGRENIDVRSIGQHAQSIQQSVDRMMRLIAGLLNAAKIEAGTLDLELSECPVDRIVLEAIGGFRPLAEQKGLSLRSQVSKQIGNVTCDRERILQVLSNLIGNAIKFTAEGGSILVGAERRSNEIEMYVSDTGPGISESSIPHIFDRYWQAKQTARLGTGLGLSIAKGFVEAHHGRIWVKSKVGEGSTFFFTLPLLVANGRSVEKAG